MKYYKIGSAYQVAEDFEYQTAWYGFARVCEQYSLSIDGLLMVKKYYAWDGPSGAFHTKTFVKGSCIHDIGCDMINNGVLPMSMQPLVDEEMMKINRRQGMWAPRRLWVYMAVRFHQVRKKVLASAREILTVP